jgi:ribose transport system substrate-binding protein
MRRTGNSDIRKPIEVRNQRRNLAISSLLLAGCVGCSTVKVPTIAFIPRTTANMFWESAHDGAQAAAHAAGVHIYWNAPTREDDAGAQTTLVQQAINRKYQGLILAPDGALELITPVRRAIDHGLFVVIIGSPMPLPAGESLSYVLNDEAEGGRLAAQRAALILHGRGLVAILGINPGITGTMVRARSFEQFLAQHDPDVHVVEKRIGTFEPSHEQQMAEETLKAQPRLNLIVALSGASLRGAISTIEGSPANHSIKVIGFDPGTLLFDKPNLDSLIVQNTHAMGSRAVSLIAEKLRGKVMPEPAVFQPLLVTRENVDSDEVRSMVTMNWQPESSVEAGNASR